MNATNTRTAREAHSEVMRELGVRRRCYGRWIQDGKLTEVDATDRMERLERAADIIERAILLAETQGTVGTVPRSPLENTPAATLPTAEAVLQSSGLSPELVTSPHCTVV